MSGMQTKLDYADAIADWFLDMGEASSLRGDLDQGIKYTYVGATIIQRRNRYLLSARLESNLQFIASNLVKCDSLQLAAPIIKNGEREVCLHVMSEALPTGRISSMVTRWMRSDGTQIHGIMLIDSQLPIPDPILQTVTNAGENVCI